jgi:hypothetical protein
MDRFSGIWTLLVGTIGFLSGCCFAELAPPVFLDRVTAHAVTVIGVAGTGIVAAAFVAFCRRPSSWHFVALRRNVALAVICLAWLFGAAGGFAVFYVIPGSLGWLSRTQGPEKPRSRGRQSAQSVLVRNYLSRTPAPMSPADLEIAEQFGHWISQGNYSAAHALLTEAAQILYSPVDFQWSFEAMTQYAPGPVEEVTVVTDYVLEEWPDQREGDVGIVYVALTGAGYNEAVILTLAREAGNTRVREVEWGRP